MIVARSEAQPFRTKLSNGSQTIHADVDAGKGGGGEGFRPHELLESSLAACINIMVRMYAQNHGLALAAVETRVTLDRGNPEESLFRYELELEGELSAEDRAKLRSVVQSCPVRQTLSRRIRFEAAE
jgi:putative redox protein